MWLQGDLSRNEESLGSLPFSISPLPEDKKTSRKCCQNKQGKMTIVLRSMKSTVQLQHKNKNAAPCAFVILLSFNLKLLLLRKPFSALKLNGKFKPPAPR